MGQALYRKYRSKSLDEVIGQEHIVTTLKNAIKAGNISHAYLFTGPRGVGKTSVARILAHEVNGIPYDDDSMHMDIIEIDAASNRRIDEIRDLRDKVHISPTSAKYKVYIIDEVHMLTKEAFNALLKTLEEPPAHVIFILATTEAHKLPETIVSRTQRFSFKPIEQNEAVNHLQFIAKKENIKIDDAALQLIAQHGDGSFRDSISLLDQAASSNETITKDSILQLLGIAPQEAIKDLYKKVAGSSPKDILAALQTLRDQGFNAAIVAKQLSEVIRNVVIAGTATHDDIGLLKTLLLIPGSSNPWQLLEITLIEKALEQSTSGSTAHKATATVQTNIVKQEPQQEETLQLPKTKKAEEQLKEKATKKEETQHKPSATETQVGAFAIELWPQVLALLKQKYNTLYGILRMAEPEYDKEKTQLILTFAFPFHEKRMKEAKNQQIIGDAIKQVSGQAVIITCVTVKKPVAKVPGVQPAPRPANIESISNIFGGAELID
jgi:DNA polymerase-3 subunit gamma/tau